jgi:hypothetical protein
MTETKVCTRCQVERSRADFYTNTDYRDNLMSWCKPCVGLRGSTSTALLRVEALLALGGKCGHCDTDDLRVLVIDHPNGGGREDRAQFGSLRKFYRYVAEHPREYQILCHNANHIKRIEAGEHRRGQYSDIRRELPVFAPPDRSAALRRNWQNPEYRTHQQANMAAAWTDARRAKMTDRAESRRQRLLDTIASSRETTPAGEWGGGFSACLGCGRTDRRHKARGVCDTCNATVRRTSEERARRAATARSASASGLTEEVTTQP